MSVSVIIPCFNGEKHLREAIESVLAQDLQPTEVIVVDDGSTDRSPEIARSFGPPVIVIEQPNRGVSATRNHGILRATGEIVAFLDADDLLLPGCLERRVAMLQSQNSDVLIGSYASLNSNGALEPRKHNGVPSNSVSFWDMLGGDYCVGQSGMLVRREFFERVGGFDPLMAACEDWDWQVRASVFGSVGFDAEPLVAYRQVQGSASRSALRMAEGVDMVMRKNRIHAPSQLTYSWVSLRARTRVYGAMLFYRALTEGSSSGLAKLLVRKPGLMPHFMVWLGRAGFNRLARLVGR